MNETRLPSLSAAATYSVSVPPGAFLYSVPISQIRIAVGERVFLRLDHQVQRVGALRSHAFEIKCFEYSEHFQGDETLRRRWHLADLETAIIGADRLDPIRTMSGKILPRKKSTEFFRATNDLLRNLAVVKKLRAFLRDPPQRLCHARVLENFSCSRRPPIDQIIYRRAFVRFQSCFRLFPLLRRQLGDRETVFSVANRRLQDIG
jgi:hypothetical protein